MAVWHLINFDKLSPVSSAVGGSVRFEPNSSGPRQEVSSSIILTPGLPLVKLKIKQTVSVETIIPSVYEGMFSSWYGRPNAVERRVSSQSQWDVYWWAFIMAFSLNGPTCRIEVWNCVCTPRYLSYTSFVEPFWFMMIYGSVCVCHEPKVV